MEANTLEKKDKNKGANHFRCAKFRVCGENKSVFVHAEKCIGLMWALHVYTDEHTATLDLCESSAQS